MRETHNLEMGGYYLFESKSCGRNCYFENKEEIRIFEILLKRYLLSYIELHKFHISSEGYRILLRVRTKETVLKRYRMRSKKEGKEIKSNFIQEPWRIISEQVRILHSTYAKVVNKMRNREGVLVQRRYRKFYFECFEEYEAYILKMEERCEVIGQRNKKYRVERSWISRVKWGYFHGQEWIDKHMHSAFQGYVVSELIKNTTILHSPPP